MTVTAARLDKDDVFVAVDELADETKLTARHLPQITRCDLAPGQYKWIADDKNPYGGAFWPIKWLALKEQLKLDIAAAQARREIAISGRPAERREASRRKPRPRRT